MLKLQSRVNRRVGKKEYRKWYVDIPPNKIEEIGWSEGDELDIKIKRNELTLKPQKKKTK